MTQELTASLDPGFHLVGTYHWAERQHILSYFPAGVDATLTFDLTEVTRDEFRR